MANAPTDVNVNVNLSGVSYANGAWSGTPTWHFVPHKAHVLEGDNTVTWTLHASNPGQGYSAAFPSSSPIVFKSTNDPQWPGGTPTIQSDGTVDASDNFDGVTATYEYKYTTSVVVTAPGGATQTFTHDPDIENDPGGVICHGVAVTV
jgi:hypothetical protein